MSHPIPEDAQRLALRLRLLADEIESAARYGVPIPSLVSVGGHVFSGASFAATEHEFAAWAEYAEATVDHAYHHGADWSSAEVTIGDGDRLPLRFSIRHDAAEVTA
jgi:hypothetical protein